MKRLIAALLIFCLLVSPVSAQSLFKTDSQDNEKFSGLFPGISQIPDIQANSILEAPVDPEEYRVGPSDQLLLGIWGTMPMNIPLVVTADGMISVPKVGVFDVRQKTLAECRQILHDGVGQIYKFDELTLNLTQPRQMQIMILGSVNNPGFYPVAATDRLHTLLTLAGGITLRGSWQRIQIDHRDETQDIVDYLSFLQHGDLSQNPVLREGDQILVPVAENAVILRGALNLGVIHPISETAQINRVTTNPMIEPRRGFSYEFAEGQTMRQLIAEMTRLFTQADIHRITVETSQHEITFDMALADQIPTRELTPGMIVTIPVLDDYVYVTGAVMSPGAYRYNPNLTINDYVLLAGGVDPRYGKGDGWKLLDPLGKKQEVGKHYIPKPGEGVEVPRRFSVAMQEYLTPILSVAGIVISTVALSTK